jgi:hypothetical protein
VFGHPNSFALAVNKINNKINQNENGKKQVINYAQKKETIITSQKLFRVLHNWN